MELIILGFLGATFPSFILGFLFSERRNNKIVSNELIKTEEKTVTFYTYKITYKSGRVKYEEIKSDKIDV